MQDVPQISQNPRPNVPTGSITILNTPMGTNNLLPNATFMITPNPYTLSNSLAVHDNDTKSKKNGKREDYLIESQP